MFSTASEALRKSLGSSRHVRTVRSDAERHCSVRPTKLMYDKFSQIDVQVTSVQGTI